MGKIKQGERCDGDSLQEVEGARRWLCLLRPTLACPGLGAFRQDYGIILSDFAGKSIRYRATGNRQQLQLSSHNDRTSTGRQNWSSSAMMGMGVLAVHS